MEVAVKVIRSNDIPVDQFRTLVQELYLMNHLKKTSAVNIVTLYGIVDRGKDLPWIVMELFRGGTLFDVIFPSHRLMCHVYKIRCEFNQQYLTPPQIGWRDSMRGELTYMKKIMENGKGAYSAEFPRLYERFLSALDAHWNARNRESCKAMVDCYDEV